MPKKSIALRALLALILMIGFYCLAIIIAGVLLYIPYAEVTYAERINGRITIFCLAGAVIILWSILPRFDKFIPSGPRLYPEKHPELFKELTEIATKTGQEMPKEVYLVQDVNAWVSQRGGIMGIGSKRVMGLGLPLLQVLNVSQLRAVIAHEFGHYYGGDTKLSPLIYKTRGAIVRTLNGLSGHSSILQKPFIWYGNLFLKISHAVSRAQELTADRLAANITGSNHMINGLCITHGAGLAYESYWKNEVVPVLGAGYKPPIADGFNSFIKTPSISNAIKKIVQNQIDNSASNPYDTHPPLKERIENVKSNKNESEIENEKVAISLVNNVNEMEKQILSCIADKNKVNALKPINWEEAGVEIYIPFWESSISEQTLALKDINTNNLPELAKNLDPFIKIMKKGFDASIPLETIAGNVIGAVLSVVLYHKGWKVRVLPGESIILSNGELIIEPFSILKKLSSDEISIQEWNELCENYDISNINLGRVAVGVIQREEQLVSK